MKRALILTTLLVFVTIQLHAQACTPLGDQVTYGTNDVWIGYIYDNSNFTSYSGYVTEGVAGNPSIDESFGGDYVNYATNGCSVYTETFSARYKLSKNFASGNYQITVGGDDGYRLSLDGGATWVINNWFDQSYGFTTYVTTLSGITNMVLEYYENGGSNPLRSMFNRYALESKTKPFMDPEIYGRDIFMTAPISTSIRDW